MSFTLLTLPQATLRTNTLSETGSLVVECITDGTHAPEGKGDDSMVLVFRLGSQSHKLEQGSAVKLVISHDGQREYSFDNGVAEKSDSGKPGSTVHLIIPPPTEDTPHVAEDIETFDHLLTQYAELSWTFASPSTAPPPLPARSGRSPAPGDGPHQANIKENVDEAKPVADPDLRGRLVLMDEANGDIVGELPKSMDIREDPALPATAQASDAVVLEMQPEMYDACTGVKDMGAEGDELVEAREVIVRAIPPEEHDWLLKGATLVSQAISGSTSLLVTGITSASNYYIAHSAPGTPKPPSANGTPSPSSTPAPSSSTLARAHAMSGQARAVTSKTADLVGNMIARAVGGKAKSTVSSNTPASTGATPVYATTPQGPPPPYSVYTPKRRPQPSRVSSEKAIPEGGQPAEQSQAEPARGPPGMKDKLLMSANLLLTTVDDSARRVFEVGSDRLGAVMGHKYGPEAQHSTHLATHTARNVVLVYVDMRGFARRALLKKAGKEFVKARVGGSKAQPAAPETAVKA